MREGMGGKCRGGGRGWGLEIGGGVIIDRTHLEPLYFPLVINDRGP